MTEKYDGFAALRPKRHKGTTASMPASLLRNEGKLPIIRQGDPFLKYLKITLPPAFEQTSLTNDQSEPT